MQTDLRAGLTGAIAGIVATAPMTAVMLVGQKLGFLGESPPRLMSSVALGAAGDRDPGNLKAKAVSVELHLGIGTGSGLVYGVLDNRLPDRLQSPVRGALYGLVVWLLAYRGVVPALKIMPPIEKDRPDRQVVMALAHVVYGAVLGWLVKRWRS